VGAGRYGNISGSATYSGAGDEHPQFFSGYVFDDVAGCIICIQKAVSIYSVEAIARVAADGHQAFPGAYGENLTLLGLDWGGLRRGDRLRIGEAGPLLHLTDYATPCDTQQRWFVDGRYGRISSRKHPEDARWYASVVEQGDVEPGDEVHLIRTF